MRKAIFGQSKEVWEEVAIPSNRVNVSYHFHTDIAVVVAPERRNPLKSGQCFLQEGK